jgi:hypothetical protein
MRAAAFDQDYLTNSSQLFSTELPAAKPAQQELMP